MLKSLHVEIKLLILMLKSKQKMFNTRFCFVIAIFKHNEEDNTMCQI